MAVWRAFASSRAWDSRGEKSDLLKLTLGFRDMTQNRQLGRQTHPEASCQWKLREASQELRYLPRRWSELIGGKIQVVMLSQGSDRVVVQPVATRPAKKRISGQYRIGVFDDGITRRSRPSVRWCPLLDAQGRGFR